MDYFENLSSIIYLLDALSYQPMANPRWGWGREFIVWMNKARQNKTGRIEIMFGWGLDNRLVKDLRKDKGYTLVELAVYLKIDSIELKRVDRLKLKDVPEPLKGKLLPLFRGDNLDKIPW